MKIELPATEVTLPPLTSTLANSPEFEFWKLSDPQPNLLSADQLFSGGFLLPLHNLSISNEPPPSEAPPSSPPESPRPSCTFPSNTKRWRQIFRKTDKKNSLDSDKDVAGGKDRKRITAAIGIVASPEININIWPFSRSRSAGTSGGRPRIAASARKVSSAPCSRSNSTGESKSRKQTVSTVTGVHLGRTNPILKIRRNSRRTAGENASASKSAAGLKTKVLNLNVPMCIGYRQNSSCSREESSPIDAAVAATAADILTEGTAVGGDEVRRSNLLSIRNLFTKKVY